MIKKLFMALVFTTCLVGCKEDENKVGNYSPIYINGVDAGNKSIQQRRSVHEILTRGTFYLKDTELFESFDGEISVMTTGKQFLPWDNNIDTINDRLIMDAGNVLFDGQLNWLGGSFLRGRNYYIQYVNLHTDEDGNYNGNGVKEWLDTVGYIPNHVIEEAQIKILDLWKEGKVDEIYKTFQDAFYFIPCTGEEFKSIKDTTIDFWHYCDELDSVHGDTHLIRWD